MTERKIYELPTNVTYPLNDWSVIEAAGADATKFLNNFCTNDLTKLSVGESCEAFFTDVKARVLAYATVGLVEPERWMICLSSPGADTLANHLDRYLIAEKVTLTTLENQELSFANSSELAESDSVRIRLTAYGPSAFVLLGDKVEELDSQKEKTFEQIRILLGIPKDQQDVDERNLPQEVDRVDQTINFHKGCYLGQEPIARIDALGRVNWLLRGLITASDVEINANSSNLELTKEGKAVGRITSATNYEGQTYCLAYIRREYTKAGVELDFNGNLATVSELPFEV